MIYLKLTGPRPDLNFLEALLSPLCPPFLLMRASCRFRGHRFLRHLHARTPRNLFPPIAPFFARPGSRRPSPPPLHLRAWFNGLILTFLFCCLFSSLLVRVSARLEIYGPFAETFPHSILSHLLRLLFFAVGKGVDDFALRSFSFVFPFLVYERSSSRSPLRSLPPPSSSVGFFFRSSCGDSPGLVGTAIR